MDDKGKAPLKCQLCCTSHVIYWLRLESTCLNLLLWSL